jgi:hypothetical protein
VSRYLGEQADCVAAGVDLSPTGVLALTKNVARISEALHAPKVMKRRFFCVLGNICRSQ